MLGRVIRRVSGQRAQDFITENLLRPLAMDRTTWVQPTDDDWARPFHVVDDQRVPDVAATRRRSNRADGWTVVVRVGPGALGRVACRRVPASRRCRRRAAAPRVAAGDATGAAVVPNDAHGGDAVRATKPFRNESTEADTASGCSSRTTHRFGHFVAHSGGLPGYGSNMRWLPGRGVGVIALANVTYAPMSVMARRMLEIIDEHGLDPTADVRPVAGVAWTPRTDSPCCCRTGPTARRNELFADNVALDDSFDQPSAAGRGTDPAHGVLTLENVAAVTPMRGRATMRHADGTERQFDLELSPLVPAQLQLYEVVAE